MEDYDKIMEKYNITIMEDEDEDEDYIVLDTDEYYISELMDIYDIYRGNSNINTIYYDKSLSNAFTGNVFIRFLKGFLKYGRFYINPALKNQVIRKIIGEYITEQQLLWSYDSLEELLLELNIDDDDLEDELYSIKEDYEYEH